ncbi:hypothetical protein ABK040_009452 [Willaertia magna]
MKEDKPSTSRQQALQRLSPKVNRILYVRGLPQKITTDEIYDLFGKFGAIRQIRLGNSNKTKGSAYVIYEDIFDARDACENLSGFNVGGRYLNILYYLPEKQLKKINLDKKREELEKLKNLVNSSSATNTTNQ